MSPAILIFMACHVKSVNSGRNLGSFRKKSINDMISAVTV